MKNGKVDLIYQPLAISRVSSEATDTLASNALLTAIKKEKKPQSV